MTTDFTTKVSSFPGGLMPEATDTPLDIRTRVETEADILSIPKPYIGMVVYVKDTGKRFEVLTLKDKRSGLKVIKNGAVNTYRELTVDQDLSHLASKADEDAREIYTTDQLTVNSLGGIAAGANLNGLTVKEILTKLLYPYTKPLVSATSAPNGGIYEKGDNKTITNVKFDVISASTYTHPGSSGGILYNNDFNLVGIVYAACSYSTGEFICSYSIPCEKVLTFLKNA